MKRKVIQCLFFLMSILVGCQSDKVRKLSDLDLDQLVDLSVNVEDSTILFKNLDSGFYFFVEKSCTACLDQDLAKIDAYNKDNIFKVYVVVNDPLAKERVGYFLKHTEVFTMTSSLSDDNVLLKKVDNVISFSNIEQID